MDEIYNPEAAGIMGIHKVGQVCIMLHSGSRGLGHQVATGEFRNFQNRWNETKPLSDALQVMEKCMDRDKINVNDRQVCCALS